MGQEIILPPAFQRPTGKMILSADQLNLVNLANTLVLLDTIPAGYTDGIEDVVNHRITPILPGYYSLAGLVTFSDVIDATNYKASIQLGGIIICENIVTAHVGFMTAAFCGLASQYISAGTNVLLYATSYSGGDTVDIDSQPYRTFLNVQRVR